jgi:hypothetical protein
MSSDVAIYAANVPDRMRYAEALAQASLLPEAYRRQPANVLLALESGAALNVAPMVAIQEIHVIKGKPTLSAQLQSALVRRAGHRLRVTGDATSAVCEITRADDPDFTFRSEWTRERAQAAGLLTNDTWRKYPQNMLKARAISECARDAGPDVIVGFGYTAEELGDENDTADAFPQTDTGSATPAESPSETGAAAGSTPAGSPDPVSHIEDAVIVEDSPTPVLDATREAMGLSPKERGPRPARGPSEKQVELVAIRCSQALKALGVPVSTEARCLLVGEYLQRAGDVAVIEVEGGGELACRVRRANLGDGAEQRPGSRTTQRRRFGESRIWVAHRPIGADVQAWPP